ncbi:MAG: hypothetical protein JWM08_1510, partial [Candidatus Angelobacter sp.]|nr:hypothetical protein [Candidatus Angelobacter sp.]
AGDAQSAPAASHLPENTGDKDMEVIVIELKGNAATSAKPAKAAKPAKTEAAKPAKG